MISELSFLVLWWVAWLVPYKGKNRWGKICFYGIITALLCVTGVTTAYTYYNTWYPMQYVYHASAVHIGPDEHYAIHAHVQAGDLVRLMDRQQRWCKIKNNLLSGWVVVDCIET